MFIAFDRPKSLCRTGRIRFALFGIFVIRYGHYKYFAALRLRRSFISDARVQLASGHKRRKLKARKQ